MKVISHGTNNRATCNPGCGTVLDFTSLDVTLRHQPINVGPWEVECVPEPEDHYQAQVTCPDCGKPIAVKVSRELKRQMLANRERY